MYHCPGEPNGLPEELVLQSRQGDGEVDDGHLDADLREVVRVGHFGCHVEPARRGQCTYILYICIRIQYSTYSIVDALYMDICIRMSMYTGMYVHVGTPIVPRRPHSSWLCGLLRCGSRAHQCMCHSNIIALY